MPSVLVTESLALELGAQEPWPQDVKLYQPYEVEQILLPDNANCLAVQAYLKMCGLNFQVEPRSNAEYMSPSGRVPFIKCGAFIVSELDPIIAFVNSKGVSLTTELDSPQKADMRAYMSLVNTVLANAELYVCWCDSTTLKEITKPRYGSVFPWPLNHVISWQKRNQVTKRLGILGWSQRSLDDVYSEVESCCNALSERLENKTYFFGEKPTDLDALVFGHLFAILTTPLPLPDNHLAKIIRQFEPLIKLVKHIDQTFFGRSTSVSHDSLAVAPPPAEEEGKGEENGEPMDSWEDVGDTEPPPADNQGETAPTEDNQDTEEEKSAEVTQEDQGEVTQVDQPEATQEDQREVTQVDQPEATQEDEGEATQEDQPEATQEDQPEATQEDQPEATQEDQREVTQVDQPEATQEDQPQVSQDEGGGEEQMQPEEDGRW